jgi:hypothetical protein
MNSYLVSRNLLVVQTIHISACTAKEAKDLVDSMMYPETDELSRGSVCEMETLKVHKAWKVTKVEKPEAQ